MLEGVKLSLKNLPSITFEDYFLQYIMDVQDQSINREVQSSYNKLLGPSSMNCMERSINQIVEEVSKLIC